MANNVSPEALAAIRRMQQNELTESVIYEKIAAFAKGEENKATLLRLAKEEKGENATVTLIPNGISVIVK